jgi:chemotaxis protein CheC
VAVDTEFDVDIYAIPDEDDLERALDALDATRVDGEPEPAEFSTEEFDEDLIEELASGALEEVEDS